MRNLDARIIMAFSVTQFCMVTSVYAQSPIEGQLQAISQTPPQRAVGAVIEDICPAGVISDPDLQARCDEVVVGGVVNGDDISGAQAGLQAMADEENSAVRNSTVEIFQAQEGIGARLAALRGGAAQPFTVQGFTANGEPWPAKQVLPGATGGAAAAEDTGFSRLGVWVSGHYGTGDQDATSRETGFDFDAYGATGGVDYRLLDSLVIGAAFDYRNTDADLDSNAGKADTDAYSFSVYGSYYPTDELYVDLIVGGGWSDHDLERSINYSIAGTAVNQTGKADPDGQHVNLRFASGYNYLWDGWTLTPYGRFEFIHVEVDDFRERISDPTAPGSGLAVEIDDQDFQSLTLGAGGRISKAFSTPWGVLLPQVDVEYIHEFDNDADDIEGRFLGDTSGTTFFIPTEDPDRNFVIVGAGASAQFAKGWAAFAQWQGLFAYQDLDSHAVTVGLRLEL